jgi:hypothetical protein
MSEDRAIRSEQSTSRVQRRSSALARRESITHGERLVSIRITILFTAALAALLTLPLAQLADSADVKRRPGTTIRTFRNPAPIELPATNVYLNPALLYPSPIDVRGLKGKIRDVNVRLNTIAHNTANHMNVLLVGPRGQTAIVMAGVGGAQVSNVTLTLDDEARSSLADIVPLATGAHRPTNATNGSRIFPAPAPPTSGNAALSVFDGSNANGTWRLFVLDESPSDAGAIEAGWALEITTRAKGKKRR